MVSVKSLAIAGAAILIGPTAFAADMGLPLPPPTYQAPAPVAEQSGWYLRGDVGVGMQQFSRFDHSQANPAFVWPASWTIVQKDIQDTAIAGFGLGYELNNWLRFDVTGEYRSKAMFKATGSYIEFCPGGTCFDVISGNHSAFVVMANAYLDLGTWWCLTPYIGAGVGTAYNRVTGVQDMGIIADGTQGFGFAASDAAQWNLAWNVQAGLTYNVSDSLKLDFNWRFMNLGSPETAMVTCQNTPTCPGASYTLKDLTSQDFRIGFRYLLQPAPTPVVMPQPPLSTRG